MYYYFRKIDHVPVIVVLLGRVDHPRLHVVDKLLLGRHVPGDGELLLQVEEHDRDLLYISKCDLESNRTECYLSGD